MTSDARRILLRAPNWLGDAVMALPAMAAVQRATPGATLAVAAIPSIAPLFREETSARPDEVVTLDGGDEPAVLRAGRFDAVLLFPNSFRTALAARRAGIGERWGYATSFRSPLLTRAVRRPRGRVHQTTYYLDLVRGLGYEAADAVPCVRPRQSTAGRAAAMLEAAGVAPDAVLVGFAPGAAYGYAKRWPPARVADVIARLTRERGATCMLVGAEGDRPAGREIESSLPSGVGTINFIGRTDLRVLVGLLARCRAFVSNDSGAMHLAAAAGVPVTAIFGPTDERVTGPAGSNHDVLLHPVFCRPCMLRECPIDHRCMKGVTADAVFEAVSRRLEGRG